MSKVNDLILIITNDANGYHYRCDLAKSTNQNTLAKAMLRHVDIYAQQCAKLYKVEFTAEELLHVSACIIDYYRCHTSESGLTAATHAIVTEVKC